MARLSVLLSAALLFGLPTARGETDFIDSAALHAAGLVKYWQLRLPLRPGQEVCDAYLVDDQIYATTPDGHVYAVHALTGALRWTTQVTTAGYRLPRPCHAAQRVVFVIPPAMLQYDRYNGEPVRKVELRFPAGAPPLSDGTRVYLGGIDQRLYAFYLDQDFENWKARAGGQVLARPVLLGPHLYFASDDGSVYGCVAENKQLYWRTRVYGAIIADLAADQNNLFVATLDNSLFSLDPTTGGKRWRMRFSGPLYEPPVVVGPLAFQYCREDGLSVLNTGTVGVEQRLRWVLPQGRHLLTVHEGLCYVLSRDENIVVARLEDGQVVDTLPAPGFTIGMSSPQDPAAYLAATDGRLFCARRRGAAVVQAADVRQAMEVPTTQPAAMQPTEPAPQAAAAEDHLKSKGGGPPVGGKSRVSREYAGQ